MDPNKIASHLDEQGQTSFSCEGDVGDIVARLLQWGKPQKQELKEIQEDIPQWILVDQHIEYYIKTRRGYLIGYIETPEQKGILYYDGENLHEIIYKNTPYYSMPLKYAVTTVSEDKIDPDMFMNHDWTFVTPSSM